MKTLLIWEMVPEETTAYILDGDLAETAKKCAGKYININTDPDIDAALDQLSEAIEQMTPISTESPIDVEGVSCVVICGFIM